MALDAELINLKSAGTYRFERDKSEISNDVTTISNLRMVVGFSKTGPFNTVKLVTSPAQFIKLYGNIDRSLEKKGSFFHRSCLVALSEGPILCLNLMNLDPDDDQVVEKSFSTNIIGQNSSSVTLPLQALYNTDKFWYPSDEAFLNAVEVCLGNKSMTEIDSDKENWANGLLHFTNVGKKPVSILVKKASEYSTKGFNLTLNEWYGEGNVPEYLNGTSYVSDYMVEVYVVGGDFGPAMTTTAVSSLVDLDDDADGGSTGDILTKYMVDNGDESEFLSPYRRFSSDIVYQSYFDENGFIRGKNDANLVKFLNLPSVDVRAKYVGSLIPNFVDKLGRNIWIQKLVNDDTDTIGVLCSENVDLIERVEVGEDFVNENIDLIGHNVFSMLNPDENTFGGLDFDFLSYKFHYDDEAEVVIVNGDKYESTPEANPDLTEEPSEHPFAWIRQTSTSTLYAYADSSYLKVGDKLYDANGAELGSVTGILRDVKPMLVEFKAEENVTGLCDSFRNDYVPRDNEVVLSINSNVVVGDYLVSDWYAAQDVNEELVRRSRVTRVVEVRNIYKKKTDGVEKYGILVVCSDKIYKRGVENNIVVKMTPIDNMADRLHWVSLKGFQVRKEIMPDGTNKRQNMILDMLRDNPEYPSTVSNLYRALIDRDYVQWRYLVDSFGLGLEEGCKDVYTKLCQGRKAALAIVNCPSQLDFKKSLDPSFTNKMGGVEAEYIANGGNREKNPSFLFSLPTIENGASWGAYYYPYLRITDLSAPKSVPPAAYVSNLYIQKYNRGFAWSIVAGQKRGVISGNQVVGVEATLVNDNRDWLEPVGINSIIWEPGVGVEVYANKTAKQTPVSALSSIHVREAAIYIQDGVESILRKYVFEFNTVQTRLEIKTLVDDFLKTMQNNGGLYDFRTVMDTSNNTPEVIDNCKGVIDIYVEIVRGLEIIAQRLTILKTGAIAAGGFE